MMSIRVDDFMVRVIFVWSKHEWGDSRIADTHVHTTTQLDLHIERKIV